MIGQGSKELRGVLAAIFNQLTDTLSRIFRLERGGPFPRHRI
jgi:hypothetical protein